MTNKALPERVKLGALLLHKWLTCHEKDMPLFALSKDDVQMIREGFVYDAKLLADALTARAQSDALLREALISLSDSRAVSMAKRIAIIAKIEAHLGAKHE